MVKYNYFIDDVIHGHQDGEEILFLRLLGESNEYRSTLYLPLKIDVISESNIDINDLYGSWFTMEKNIKQLFMNDTNIAGSTVVNNINTDESKELTNKKEKEILYMIRKTSLYNTFSFEVLKETYFKEINGILQILTFNVGQGDTILIKLPNDKNWLVDAYASGKKRKAELIKKIKNNTCGKIDILIISHWHFDHINLIKNICEEFEIEILFGTKRRIHSSTTVKNLISWINSNRLQFHWIEKDFTISGSKNTFVQFLTPTNKLISNDRNPNNHSIVFLINHGNVKLLFSGDLENNAWQYYNNNIPKADFYKVSHHCSRNANSDHVLQNIKPSFAVISCGHNRMYNHPHCEPSYYFKKNTKYLVTKKSKKDIAYLTNGKYSIFIEV